MNWGERVVNEVMIFRAELWCSSSDMLVKKVWLAAQQYPGRTFASVSKDLLVSMGLPEVYNFAGWSEFTNTGKPVLPGYKHAIRYELEVRSCIEWKRSLHQRGNVGIHLLAQQHPVSVGAVLLNHKKIALSRGRSGVRPTAVGYCIN